MNRLLRGMVGLAFEGLKVLLRHPTVGALAIAVDGDGRYVLIRRADSGSWGLPGGWIDYGERVEEALSRELFEETGHRLVEVKRIIGVYSAPDRDPRVHSVCIAVEARVEPTSMGAANPLEVLEVKAFAADELPRELAFDGRRILDDYLQHKSAVLA